MAIPYFELDHISRGKGQSVVAASAYRAGDRLWDDRREEWQDYTRKQQVAHAEILVCPAAPEWVAERGPLWNEVEKVEKRVDARLAKDGVLALPNELSLPQNLDLVRKFLTEEFVNRSMVVDFAIHDTEGNHHCHFLTPDRHFEAGDFAPLKNRDWNTNEFLNLLKANWAELVNLTLEQAGFDQSHFISFEAEEDNPRIPQIHLGKFGAMQKRLQDSGQPVPNPCYQLQKFREIEQINQEHEAQLNRIRKAHAEADAKIQQELLELDEAIAQAKAELALAPKPSIAGSEAISEPATTLPQPAQPIAEEIYQPKPASPLPQTHAEADAKIQQELLELDEAIAQAKAELALAPKPSIAGSEAITKPATTLPQPAKPIAEEIHQPKPASPPPHTQTQALNQKLQQQRQSQQWQWGLQLSKLAYEILRDTKKDGRSVTLMEGGRYRFEFDPDAKIVTVFAKDDRGKLLSRTSNGMDLSAPIRREDLEFFKQARIQQLEIIKIIQEKKIIEEAQKAKDQSGRE